MRVVVTEGEHLGNAVFVKVAFYRFVTDFVFLEQHGGGDAHHGLAHVLVVVLRLAEGVVLKDVAHPPYALAEEDARLAVLSDDLGSLS